MLNFILGNNKDRRFIINSHDYENGPDYVEKDGTAPLVYIGALQESFWGPENLKNYKTREVAQEIKQHMDKNPVDPFFLKDFVGALLDQIGYAVDLFKFHKPAEENPCRETFPNSYMATLRQGYNNELSVYCRSYSDITFIVKEDMRRDKPCDDELRELSYRLIDELVEIVEGSTQVYEPTKKSIEERIDDAPRNKFEAYFNRIKKGQKAFNDAYLKSVQRVHDNITV